MDKLLALAAFLASLIGCDGGRDTVVHRIAGPAGDLLLSRASVQAGSARFDCVQSASGACHYLVLPPGCVVARTCADRSRRFEVAAGQSRQLIGLHAFRVCVAGDARLASAPCSAGDALGD